MARAVRLLGLALFMSSIALLGWWWAFVAGRAIQGGGWRAAALDLALFSAFAAHHSVLARSPAKQLLERLIPRELVRTAYVWAASLLLIAMCLLWRPVGGVVYSATGVAAMILAIVQLLGIGIGVLAVRRISVSELAGLSEAQPTALQRGGPYRLVRHPLYLGWVLFFFTTGLMTGDRLLFASASSIYLLIAMPLEEAGLIRQFGPQYLEYRRAVRWRLIPYLH